MRFIIGTDDEIDCGGPIIPRGGHESNFRTGTDGDFRRGGTDNDGGSSGN